MIAKGLLILSCFCVSSFASEISHIDIFTTEKGAKGYQLGRLKKLTNMPVYIHHVDAINNFQENIGGTILFKKQPTNADIERIEKNISSRLNSKDFSVERQKLQDGVKSFEKAIRLGLTQVPAVVFDDKYIVYGERPIKALQIYREKIKQ
jgi:integrating conjugative element protein (TIGR03757 family)